MRSDKLQDAIGEIRDDLIADASADIEEQPVEKKDRSWMKWLAAAAGILIAAAGTWAIIRPSVTKELDQTRTTAESAETSASKGSETGQEGLWEGWNLQQQLELRSNVFRGTCTGINVSADGTLTASFDVKENFKGVIDPEVEVEDFQAYAAFGYKIGQQYLVFCDRRNSVFWDEDIYVISGAVNEEEGKLIRGDWILDLERSEIDKTAEYIEAYAASHSEDDVTEPPRTYIDSENLDEIYAFSSCVMTVEITGIANNTISDRTWYYFSPVKVLKGETKNMDWIVSFKDSMETGGQYLVFLTRPGEYSRLFVVSAKKSVFDIHSEEARQFLQR